MILLFAGDRAVVTVLGLLWDWLFRSKNTGKDSGESDAPGLIGLDWRQRLSRCRNASGQSLALTAIALTGLALLAFVLPFGSMQNSVERDDLMAPLTDCHCVPGLCDTYVGNESTGMMFQHANSPGAAFALLILGTG